MSQKERRLTWSKRTSQWGHEVPQPVKPGAKWRLQDTGGLSRAPSGDPAEQLPGGEVSSLPISTMSPTPEEVETVPQATLVSPTLHS